MKRLQISAELRREIESHAESEYPLEACGLLLGEITGERATVKKLFIAANRAPENRHHRYNVTKEDYWSAEKVCAELNLVILGVFHSHPDSAPVPSIIDSEFAYPGWVYWISPVMKRIAGAPRLWLREEDGWTEIDVLID